MNERPDPALLHFPKTYASDEFRALQIPRIAPESREERAEDELHYRLRIDRGRYIHYLRSALLKRDTGKGEVAQPVRASDS